MNFLDLLDDFIESEPRKENETSIIFNLEPKVKMAFCPLCKRKDTLIRHGYAPNREVRDTNFSGKFVELHIKTPRYKCKSCDKTCTHIFESIHPRRQMTKRLVESIERKSMYNSLTEIATEFGLADIQTVKRIGDNFLEEMQNEPIKTPEELGVLIVSMKNVDRLFFIDLKGDGKGPSIIAIQDKVSVRQVNEAFNRIKTNDIDMVLTEARCNLWRWISMNISAEYKLIIYGPSVLWENERLLRTIFEKLSTETVHYLTDSELSSIKNKETLKELAEVNTEFKPYYDYFVDTNLSYDKQRGSYKELAMTISVGIKNNKINLLKEYIENVIQLNDNISAYDSFDGSLEEIYQDLLEIIKTIEIQGNGYSYEALKNRVLFSTRATKRAVFESPMNLSRIELSEVLKGTRELPLKSGFGVPIALLKEEFFNK